MIRRILKWVLGVIGVVLFLLACVAAVPVWRQRDLEAWDEKARATIGTPSGPETLKEACTHRVDWACHGYGDTVTFSKELGGPEKAIEWFQRGCALENATACRRLAGIHQCGRGVPVNVPKAAALYKSLCNKGDLDACDTLAAFNLDGVAVFTPASMKLRAQLASLAHARGDRARFEKEVAELESLGAKDHALFLRACDDLDQGRLSEAASGAAQLSKRLPGDKAAQLLVLLVKERAAGTEWVDAFYRSWGRVGRPDLRRTRLLPWGGAYDYFACNPSRIPKGVTPPNESDAFLVALHRHLSDVPAGLRGELPSQLLDAAVRGASSEDEVLQLAVVALSVESSIGEGARARLAPLAAERVAGLAAAHPKNLFHTLLAATWPTHRAAEALTVKELEAVEAHVEDLYEPPHARVFERLEQAWTAAGVSRPTGHAFGQMVEVLSPWSGSELSQRADLLATAQPALAPRLAKMLLPIGESVSQGGWLLEAMIGSAYRIRAARLSGSAEELVAAQARQTELRRFARGGFDVFAEAGSWPIPSISEARTRASVHEELKLYERLEALSLELARDGGR